MYKYGSSASTAGRVRAAYKSRPIHTCRTLDEFARLADGDVVFLY